MPDHTCGASRDVLPPRFDPGCPACVEGGERILDALRVDLTGLDDDPHDCFTCGLTMVRVSRSHNVEIEVTTKRPNILATWAPTAMRCEHGTIFYHRPTATQRAAWAMEMRP